MGVPPENTQDTSGKSEPTYSIQSAVSNRKAGSTDASLHMHRIRNCKKRKCEE